MRSKQRIRRMWVVSGIGIVLIVLALIYANGHWSWTWTGFNKTLWDWMQLLIIPVILAVGAFVFNLAQSRTQQQIAAQRYHNDQDIALNKQREDLLQTYFDRMSELLLNKDLRSSQPDAEVRNVARARTLTILPQLDAQRKGSLVQFLSESKLVEIINLNHANLNHADLHGADLHGAILKRANLHGAKLYGAILSNANLNHVELSEANLSEADLRSADLHHAELGGANMHGANLSNANLNHANITQEQLDTAKVK